MKNKGSIFLMAAFIPISVLAQEQQFLSKTEVGTIATGKKWNHIRVADKQRIVWDLQEGGALYAANFTSGSKDSGTWSINDDGQSCVKWRGKSLDRCVAILRDGDKLKMIDSNDLKGVYAELTVE